MTNFAAAITRGPGIALIAELKRASPSAGVIRPDYDVEADARAYAWGGAAALSVLVEPKGFMGDIKHVAQAKAASGLPILYKGFITTPDELMGAIQSGADAVLLITALSYWKLIELIIRAEDSGVTPLVEIHTLFEMDIACQAGARVIGVNCRDLTTSVIDYGVFERLIPRLPENITVVAESGIRGPKDIQLVKSLGADAVLVGEHLLRQADLETAARELVEAGL